MTTGRERVSAALALDMADRPPTSAWGHTYDLEWDVAKLAASTVAIARQNQFDFVKLQVRATCFAEAFGGAYEPSGSPEIEPLLKSAGATSLEAWRQIAEGAHDPAPLADQVRVLHRVAETLGAGVPVITYRYLNQLSIFLMILKRTVWLFLNLLDSSIINI